MTTSSPRKRGNDAARASESSLPKRLESTSSAEVGGEREPAQSGDSDAPASESSKVAALPAPASPPTDAVFRANHLVWNGAEWVDDRCGCRYHPDDDNGSHGGAPHVHRCEKHRGPPADRDESDDERQAAAALVMALRWANRDNEADVIERLLAATDHPAAPRAAEDEQLSIERERTQRAVEVSRRRQERIAVLVAKNEEMAEVQACLNAAREGMANLRNDVDRLSRERDEARRERDAATERVRELEAHLTAVRGTLQQLNGYSHGVVGERIDACDRVLDICDRALRMGEEST